MMFATRISALRNLACAALLAVAAANAHAGALADGIAIAGELYAASLVGVGPPARSVARATPAGPALPDARVERPVDRVAATGGPRCGCGAAVAPDGGSERMRVAPEVVAVGARVAPPGRPCAGPHRDAPERNRIEGVASARIDAP